MYKNVGKLLKNVRKLLKLIKLFFKFKKYIYNINKQNSNIANAVDYKQTQKYRNKKYMNGKREFGS